MAQRHLWTTAYQLPFTVEKADQPAKPVNDVLRTDTGTGRASHRPRILIAKPKALNHNDKIRLSLERAYPTEYKSILDQAYAAYYFTNPASRNLPEIYELLESGFLDQGIEACGLHSWVIGRSK